MRASVICDEHGDEFDAVELVDKLQDCEHDHLVGIDGESGADHDSCPIARMLRQSSDAPRLWSPPLVATIVTTTLPSTPSHSAVAADLYLIAPKTSPPV